MKCSYPHHTKIREILAKTMLHHAALIRNKVCCLFETNTVQRNFSETLFKAGNNIVTYM